MNRQRGWGGFDLSKVIRGWSGPRILELKAPIERGLQTLREQLAGKAMALILTRTEFDYDGMLPSIVSIEPADLPIDRDLIQARVQALTAAELAEHPEWAVLDRDVIPYEKLPSTGTIVPGRFPAHICGIKAGAPELYASVYIRAAIVAAAPGRTLAEAVLALDGLGDELANYVQELGAVDRL